MQIFMHAGSPAKAISKQRRVKPSTSPSNRPSAARRDNVTPGPIPVARRGFHFVLPRAHIHFNSAILEGEADDWAENSLYMVGGLDEARRKETRPATDAP
jgi:hypothetical protein